MQAKHSDRRERKCLAARWPALPGICWLCLEVRSVPCVAPGILCPLCPSDDVREKQGKGGRREIEGGGGGGGRERVSERERGDEREEGRRRLRRERGREREKGAERLSEKRDGRERERERRANRQ